MDGRTISIGCLRKRTRHRKDGRRMNKRGRGEEERTPKRNETRYKKTRKRRISRI